MTVRRSVAAGAAALVLAGCAGGDEAVRPPAATTAAATPTPRPTEPSVKPPPRLVTLGDVPLAATDLHDAYFHWTGETVTVAGYPALATRRAKWQSSVELGAAPDAGTAALLHCDMAGVPDGGLTVDTALTLRGRVVGDGRMFAVPEGMPPKSMLEECELLSSGTAVPVGGDPYTLGTEPIPVALLHSAMFGWQGAVVEVVGHFAGTTTSTPGFDEGRTVTSHAINAAADGDKLVECIQPGAVEAPDAVTHRRAETVVAGTIGEPRGDAVVLDDCWFVGIA